MQVEERLLIEKFGDEYRLFSKRTKKLIPGIW
jgi:protein-S-isoprenylcysteine O-methyltransferase Ste14